MRTRIPDADSEPVTPWGVMSQRTRHVARPTARAVPQEGHEAAAGLKPAGRSVTVRPGFAAPLPPTPEKPRTREVQRLLAAAVSLGGGSVEDYLLATVDTEEVPTRTRVKRSVRVQRVPGGSESKVHGRARGQLDGMRLRLLPDMHEDRRASDASNFDAGSSAEGESSQSHAVPVGLGARSEASL